MNYEDAVKMWTDAVPPIGPSPKSSAPARGAVLEEARKVINGERQDSYGNPEDSFYDIALLWGWYLGRTLASKDVALMMALLKFAREKHQGKRDNIVDACGYLGIYGDLVDD